MLCLFQGCRTILDLLQVGIVRDLFFSASLEGETCGLDGVFDVKYGLCDLTCVVVVFDLVYGRERTEYARDCFE